MNARDPYFEGIKQLLKERCSGDIALVSMGGRTRGIWLRNQEAREFERTEPGEIPDLPTDAAPWFHFTLGEVEDARKRAVTSNQEGA